MRYCNACGDKAVTSCPHCNADACGECIPICEHDARKPPEKQEQQPASFDVKCARCGKPGKATGPVDVYYCDYICAD